jgi:xylan 1,4-beta-xylosidase
MMRMFSFTRFRQLGLLFVFMALILCCIGLPTLATSPFNAKSLTATIDFSVNAPQKNMSGFLHGLGRNTPSDALILPLKPALWRISSKDNHTYTRALQVGAQVEIVISDAYGYPLNHWYGHGAPWENNWTHWEAYVRQLARQYRGQPVYWDIWNEPDTREWNRAQFWNGTQQQYFETYKRAYLILREELGSTAMIGGPSYANYTQPDLAAFLSYCNQHNLEVNFLSWHELMQADFAIPAVAQHITDMRQLASTYPKLRMQKILINESVGPKTTYFPGDILGFLYYMEKGGADGANRACWNDSKGRNNCFNQSLDGLIDTETNLPRAAWWAYKTYADGIASRVKTTANSPNLVVMASKSPAQVLIGYLGQNETNPAQVTIHLYNLGLIGQTGDHLKVTVCKAPTTGEAPLATLLPVNTVNVAVTQGGAATLVIPAMQLHEEYVLKLLPQ